LNMKGGGRSWIRTSEGVSQQIYSLLDEQQRRLYAGLESLEWGHGGDQRMRLLPVRTRRSFCSRHHSGK